MRGRRAGQGEVEWPRPWTWSSSPENPAGRDLSLRERLHLRGRLGTLGDVLAPVVDAQRAPETDR